MSLTQQDIANLTLSELVVPGTHDTGTYALIEQLAPDVNVWVQDLLVTLRKMGVEKPYQVIKGWADTQNSDVYTQLYKGARFLDIRVCWSKDTAMYHTLHFILGSPTEEMLGNITQFLTDFPEEIVILQWGSFAGFNDTQHDNLVMLMHKYLGPFGMFPKSLAPRLAQAAHILPKVGRPVKPLESRRHDTAFQRGASSGERVEQGEGDRLPFVQGAAGIEDRGRSRVGVIADKYAYAGLTFTYGDMLRSGKRVLVLYDDMPTANRYDELWPSQEYLVSDWANVDNFPAMLDHETKSVQSQTGNPDAVYKLQWVLTTSAKMIVNAILNPWDKLRDLHQLSRLANGNNFESFMKEMINYRINILMTDYQSEVNSLDWARVLNRLNCNDAREYRQIDCPVWKKEGSCANNVTVQQLCPLSCNACNWTRIEGKPGDKCVNNTQCLFGVCNQQAGICLNDSPGGSGDACGVDSQCLSGSCSNFACTAPVERHPSNRGNRGRMALVE